jgi:hypothetical protein
LTVATLVSAIVVVLWGIKIFYSVWTGQEASVEQEASGKKRFATKASIPRRRKPAVPIADEEFAARSSFPKIGARQ